MGVPDDREAGPWQRRARVLLGTLVEIGVVGPSLHTDRCLGDAFDAIGAVQAQLSRFEATSDVSRFKALPAGEHLRMRAHTRVVLEASRALAAQTGGVFDVTLGTAPAGWACDGDRLRKLDSNAALDLGGIAKGHAVDCAVRALQAAGCRAGWVNAGGDLRAFGDVDLPIRLRVEDSGGVRPFATLRDGAFATSHFGPATRSQLAGTAAATAGPRHVSVAAPECLWADALSKVVAATGEARHPVLARYDAVAWIH